MVVALAALGFSVFYYQAQAETKRRIATELLAEQRRTEERRLAEERASKQAASDAAAKAARREEVRRSEVAAGQQAAWLRRYAAIERELAALEAEDARLESFVDSYRPEPGEKMAALKKRMELQPKITDLKLRLLFEKDKRAQAIASGSERWFDELVVAENKAEALQRAAAERENAERKRVEDLSRKQAEVEAARKAEFRRAMAAEVRVVESAQAAAQDRASGYVSPAEKQRAIDFLMRASSYLAALAKSDSAMRQPDAYDESAIAFARSKLAESTPGLVAGSVTIHLNRAVGFDDDRTHYIHLWGEFMLNSGASGNRRMSWCMILVQGPWVDHKSGVSFPASFRLREPVSAFVMTWPSR